MNESQETYREICVEILVRMRRIGDLLKGEVSGLAFPLFSF